MVEAARFERRRHERRVLNSPAQVVHPASGRTFGCRCGDASADGAGLMVPMTMPVQVGHAVQILPPEPLASQLQDVTGSTVTATVVRIDRERLLLAGHVWIGVQFAEGVWHAT
jgi:hypothetical protein